MENGFIGVLARAFIPLGAVLLSVLSVIFGWGWVLWVTVPLAILGLYDFVQDRWTITRNYPVIGRIRWLFHELRPFVRQYIVEDDLNSTPYSFDARKLVYSRARNEPDTQPFGTERQTDEPEYHWLAHSIAATPMPDETPRVFVGDTSNGKGVSVSVLNISAMSFGSLSENAIEALNLAAKTGGFYHDTGEGGISRYHLRHGGDLVWEIGSGYFGARDKDGNFDPQAFADNSAHEAVKMTELKLSQGAKPGHGGLLPGPKVTDEIAKIRGIQAHQDCASPASHSAFSTPNEMMEFVGKMRDLSKGKPVGFKLCVGQPHQVFALMKAILNTGIYPDFIVIDGAEGGTGAAPLEFSDWVGAPLHDGLLLMRNALVGCGLKDRVRLVAGGKIYSGMGLARAMAMGADWCNAARAFMFSIGCIQSQRCHLGTCPTGIATQDEWRQRGLIPEVQAERAARFHQKTVHALSEIVAALGLAHPSELRPHHVFNRCSADTAAPIDRLHTFLGTGALIDAPEETIYAKWWNMATPDSFLPHCD